MVLANQPCCAACIAPTCRLPAGDLSITGWRTDSARAADADIVHLRHEIGHVTQFLRPPRVSALDFVAEPLLQEGVSAEDACREATHWLQAFGLKREIWAAYPATFSGASSRRPTWYMP